MGPNLTPRATGKTIAITGASGFIGRHLAARLSGAGHALRLLARDPKRIKAGHGHEIVAGDLGERTALEALCAGVGTVIHCAGLVTASSREDCERVNARATGALAATAARAGVKRFIFVSSLAAREPRLSAYAASKKNGEDRLREVGSALSWVVLRPPPVYGPNDDRVLIILRQFLRRLPIIPANRHGRLSLLYVDDLVTALQTLLEGGPEGSIHELHDGTPGGYSWVNIIDAARQAGLTSSRCLFAPRPVMGAIAGLNLALAKLTARAPVLTPDKVRELYHHDWVCRNNLLDSCTSWRAKTRFAAGLVRTLGLNGNQTPRKDCNVTGEWETEYVGDR